ncbi:MAG: VOC family protein [Pseudomonadales bacterium]
MIKSSCGLRVCDIETSIEWYEHFLGFTCVHKSSIKNPDYAVLEKEQARIYLVSDREQKSFASNIVVFETSGLEAEFSKLEEKGVIFRSSISESQFGGEEFSIKDYEDNILIYRRNA